jgi:hypothetical protein
VVSSAVAGRRGRSAIGGRSRRVRRRGGARPDRSPSCCQRRS